MPNKRRCAYPRRGRDSDEPNFLEAGAGAGRPPRRRDLAGAQSRPGSRWPLRQGRAMRPEQASSRRAWPSSPARRCAPLSGPRQASAVGLPAEGPGSLEREGRRVLAEVRFSGAITARRLRELRAAGARVLTVGRRYRTATVAIKPGPLPRLGGVEGELLPARCWRRASPPLPVAGRSSPRGMPSSMRPRPALTSASMAPALPSGSFRTLSPPRKRRRRVPPKTSSAATCPAKPIPAATRRRSTSSRTSSDRASGRSDRRGAGDGADRP